MDTIRKHWVIVGAVVAVLIWYAYLAPWRRQTMMAADFQARHPGQPSPYQAFSFFRPFS